MNKQLIELELNVWIYLFPYHLFLVFGLYYKQTGVKQQEEKKENYFSKEIDQ